MKRIFLLVAFLCFAMASAQTASAKASKKSEKTSEVKKTRSAKASKTTYSKAGKADPNEQGSGMTVPDQDKSKLDHRPNPAATVPSSQNPADSQNPLPAN